MPSLKLCFMQIKFSVLNSLRLPSIPKIIPKDWRTMTRDKKLSNTFALPPMVAFKPQISNRGRFSISKINQQMTICQQILKIWCINLFLFLPCCVKTWCIYSVFFVLQFGRLKIGPWSNLPLLDIYDLPYIRQKL